MIRFRVFFLLVATKRIIKGEKSLFPWKRQRELGEEKRKASENIKRSRKRKGERWHRDWGILERELNLGGQAQF